MTVKSIIFAIFIFAMSCVTASAQTAEIIYQGGKIYTVDKKQPWVEAVAVEGGKILKAGSVADMKQVKEKVAERVELILN